MLLARGLAARGHTVRVTSLNAAADPGLVRELSAAGVEFRAVGKAALALGLGLGPLLRDLRRDPGAVVLTLLPWADTLGRLAARRLGHTRLVSSIRARNIDKPAWQIQQPASRIPAPDDKRDLLVAANHGTDRGGQVMKILEPAGRAVMLPAVR